jgi:hypothetical protein
MDHDDKECQDGSPRTGRDPRLFFVSREPLLVQWTGVGIFVGLSSSTRDPWIASYKYTPLRATLSGIETLSLVSNVVQGITFACQKVAFCNAVYYDRAPDENLHE